MRSSLYQVRGRYDEAEPLLLETLEIQKRVLGDDHPETLTFMNNLASLYFAQGRYDEAEPLLLETLETQKRVLGDDHVETSLTVHNLACLYRDTNRLDKARLRFERVQRLWETKLSPEHHYVAANLAEYAKLLRRTGDDAEAARLEDRARAIRDKQ